MIVIFCLLDKEQKVEWRQVLLLYGFENERVSIRVVHAKWENVVYEIKLKKWSKLQMNEMKKKSQQNENSTHT